MAILVIKELPTKENQTKCFMFGIDRKIIAISEHWKSMDQLKQLDISNFEHISAFCRNKNKHGGVALYCQRGIKDQTMNKITQLSISEVFEVSGDEIIIGKQPYW